MLTLSMKMPIGEAIAVSLIGIVTVMIILAIIALLIILVSKVIRSLEATVAKKTADKKTEDAASVVAPEGVNQGEIELIDTDEKTAAVIMAIVSDKSGIPLNRLSFKSIKLIEDEKKGEK